MSKASVPPNDAGPSGQKCKSAGPAGPSPRLLGETVFAFILLSASLWVLYQSYAISGLGGYATPGALPLATSLVLVGTMIVVVVTTIRKREPAATHGRSVLVTFRQAIVPPMLPATIGMIVVYALALEVLGFVLSSVLFLSILVAILQGGHIIRAVFVSIFSVAVIHLIFRYGFEVLLPTGFFL